MEHCRSKRSSVLYPRALDGPRSKTRSRGASAASTSRVGVLRSAETRPNGPRMGQPYEATLHPPTGTPVKPNTLTIASLLSIILLPFHIGGDVALGFDRGGSGLVFVVVPILLVVACGTLLLAERRSGHVIMFLGGLAALGMPIIHRNNGFTAAVAQSPGGRFFSWTRLCFGGTCGRAMILCVLGL